jgi:hypothetical protein
LCTAAVQTVNDPILAEHLDRLGVSAVLKPFTIEDLLSALNQIHAGQVLIDQATDERAE